MSEDSVDLVVIGAGPAGMASACEARALGLSVVILDEQPTLGGQIYRNVETALPDRINILGIDYADGRRLVSDFRASGTDHRGGCTVWNITRDGVVDYIRDGRSETVAGRRVLLASGAMERPFPIPGWTLPGVMGAGAGQILLKSAGALPNTPVILAGCGPLLYLLAWQYLRAGVAITAIVDTTAASAYRRAARHAFGAVKGWADLKKGLKLLGTLRARRVRIYSGASQLAVAGSTEAEGLSFRHRGRAVTVPASLVLLHQGVVPNTQFSWALRTKHRWSDEQLCWQPETDEWGRLGDSAVYVAGDSRGIVGAKASELQGRLAALAIGQELNVAPDIERRAFGLRRALRSRVAIRPFLDALYRPLDENRVPPGDDVVICRCEEVTAGDVRRYVELGCKGPNQTKAFGRSGMGPCQGRFCGLTVTEIISRQRGVDPNDVQYYRIRAPIKPILLGDLAE